MDKETIQTETWGSAAWEEEKVQTDRGHVPGREG